MWKVQLIWSDIVYLIYGNFILHLKGQGQRLWEEKERRGEERGKRPFSDLSELDEAWYN